MKDPIFRNAEISFFSILADYALRDAGQSSAGGIKRIGPPPSTSKRLSPKAIRKSRLLGKNSFEIVRWGGDLRSSTALCRFRRVNGEEDATQRPNVDLRPPAPSALVQKISRHSINQRLNTPIKFFHRSERYFLNFEHKFRSLVKL